MHASGVRGALKRHTSDQQGFKAHANNVLLRLRISAVTRESNSTA